MKRIISLAVCVSFLLAVSLQAQAIVPLIQGLPQLAIGYDQPPVAFSPDGKKIVAKNNGAVHIWDAESGKELQQFGAERNGVRYAAFSPDGKKIATTHSYVVARIWDVGSGRELLKLDGKGTAGHSMDSTVFSPDGTKIVTTGGSALRIWDAESGRELQKWEKARTSYTVAFSPDGKKIVTAHAGRFIIWDAESGVELRKWEEKGFNVQHAAFSPDGKKIVTTNYAENTYVQIWDVESGKELQKWEDQSFTSDASFSPDGKMVLAASGNARIWNVESGEEILKLGRENYSVLSAAFSPDGKKIVVGVAVGDGYYLNGFVGIADISALPQQWADVQKRREAERKAGNVILHDERQKSGLKDLEEFLRYGNTELRDKLEAVKADPFDRAEVQAKIDAVKAEIASKKFYDEFYFSAPTSEVRVEGDKSTFVMKIETDFAIQKVDEFLFPMSNVTGEMKKTQSGTVLTVSGSTENIRDMVRNSSNYRARVLFTNLRLRTADVLKIEIIKIQ